MISKTISHTFCLVVAAIVLTIPIYGQKVKIEFKCDPPEKTAEKEAGAKRSKQRAPEKTAGIRFEPEANVIGAKSESTLTGQASILLGCVGTATVSVNPPGGPPNQTVVFTVSQSTVPNILGFRWNSNDAFTSTLQVPVQLNSSGTGISNQFQFKGLLPGTTVTMATAPQYTADEVLVTVPECACPTIVVSSPSRTP
jgi:hypothetical protein